MFLLYGILATALFTDFKSLRIANGLIVIGWMLGLFYQILQGEQWYFGILHGMMVLILFYPLYVVGVFGGGDAKLFSVIGIFLGIETTINVFLFSLLIGAVCSGIKIFFMLFQKKRQSYKHLYIHFSLPIFLGTILVQFGGITWITF